MVNGIIKTKERKGKKVEQGAPIKKEKNRTKGHKGDEWNHNENKIEKENKMRKKERSANQRQKGNNNHSQERRVKRVAGDMEWPYKLLNENNGYKIMEGEQCKWHTQG